MSDFRFAEPGYVHWLWAVMVLCAGLFALERRGGQLLDRLVSPALRERLVDRPARWRRHARIALIGACLAFAVLALMRPQWGLRYIATSRASAEIMICLDVSRSMLAEDVVPNRLERAKAEIVDLLGFLDGDQVGLIAFAGRATVVAPLTPDFGFLRLVLEGVGPGSVARGGTRLAEPLRKANAGFAKAGDASRVVLLITDGEDQDSFPLDAAGELRDAGVHVVAIGIGDEVGTQVRVRDPRTGMTELLRDADGAPVVTRLDGETLRQIVSETKGVYIPAGVGSLDLAEIYEAYIRDLLRAPSTGRGRAVREEGYQWAALLAFLCLLASAAVATGRPRAQSSVVGEIVRRAAVIAFVALAPALPSAAQQGSSPDDAAASQPAPADAAATPAGEASEAGGEATSGEVSPGDGTGADGTGDEAGGAPATDQTPREVYNAGLGALGSGDFDAAELKLRRARSDGADDPELRFRATYNLGISTARRASGLEEEEPEAALRTLYAAADRFRAAVRQRPDDADARHNLEVTLRRALALSDAIARKNRGDLAEQLEKLAERERTLLQSAASIASDFGGEAAVDPARLERERRAYRGIGTEQRLLLSDADLVARQVESERAAIDAVPEEERKPEQQVRAAQLGFVTDHLFDARQHMGQARSQMRRRQGARTIRRASSALADIKRAQEQLRAPPQVLDGLVRDAVAAANRLALVGRARSGAAGDAPEPPAWLTTELLGDAERDLVDRTEELSARLRAALGPAEADPAVEDEPEAVRTEAIERAAANVDTARGAFAEADEAIEAERLEPALGRHAAAIRALLEAREWLLDLRGLIELTYADQTTLVGQLEPELAADVLRAFAAVQARNLERVARIGPLLDAEQARATASPEADPSGAQGGPTPEQLEAERKRIELAREVLGRIPDPMQQAQSALESGRRVRAKGASELARKELALLRRLFFSVVELLRETAQRQVELVDRTTEVEQLTDPARAKDALAAVDGEQGELEATANAIANDLEEQSREGGGVMSEEPGAAEVSEKLRKASELVLFAAGDMGTARKGIAESPDALEPVRESQKKAVEQLARAIALLVPPEQPKPPEKQDQDQKQDQQQNQPSGQPDPKPGQDSAERMLQAIRDREAKRQQELSDRRARQAGYDTVEKDW